MVVLPTNISLRTSCADVDFLEGCLSTCRSKCAEKGIILVTHIQRKRLQFKKFTNGCVHSQRSKKCLVRCCDDGWIVACGSLILRWRRRFKERGLIKIARILRARARCFSNFQFRKKEGTFYFLKFTSPPAPLVILGKPHYRFFLFIFWRPRAHPRPPQISNSPTHTYIPYIITPPALYCIPVTKRNIDTLIQSCQRVQ